MFSAKSILKWHSENPRTFPWRREGISAYEVWVSEIMLQQTQVSRGIVFYERFLKKFPRVEDLARAEWKDFLPYYEGLGYYNRGRNMLKTAKIIVDDFQGEFPKDKALLQKLPGIGEYTACAILSFTWDEPLVAFDTNLKKIFGDREKAERALKKSGVKSSFFNAAMMDYSREVLKTGAGRGSLTPSETLEITSLAGLRKHSGRGRRPSPAATIVVLHENHKKYFSSEKGKYVPFFMPESVSSREAIKKYFLENYGLRLSVRPPDKDGLVNAQVLLGRPTFVIFEKTGYDEWRKSHLNPSLGKGGGTGD